MTTSIPGFREVPRTGVIYVMHQARQAGYRPDDPSWANLGQGAPQIDHLPGAPPRINSIEFSQSQQEYSPVQGDIKLRQAVADMYNYQFRKGKKSQYTWENVAIAGGGRISLTRIAASLGDINMGHFIPDYTAYEELLTAFKSFIPIPIMLGPDYAYKLSTSKLQDTISGLGLSAILISNPCNPTGQVIAGQKLADWVDVARNQDCSLIIDEFYSHYIYDHKPGTIISSARAVNNVNNDPVIIIDGITKNWRYPGWRISWTLGPKSVINQLASAGSFLDGGPNHPFQNVASCLLDPELISQETIAIQKHFQEKRDFMLKELSQIGIKIDHPPQGTFYLWANLSHLPAPLNNGFDFFEEALKYKVITVPGVFFDVNPGGRRASSRHRFTSFTRLSFGPSLPSLKQGLKNLKKLVSDFS